MKWPKPHFQEFPHCNPHWKQPWCGVTGWTNFSAIFLFLLSFLHDLATIGTVAGVSDNFLIFWAALLSQTSKKKSLARMVGLCYGYDTMLKLIECSVTYCWLRLTLFEPAFFGSSKTRGGADLPPPSKNGGNGWEVPKLSWNLISYRDWCQTKGFMTFRYLEPP